METADKLRIVVVDDHPIVREGIGWLIGQAPDMEVVAEAANGLEAIERVRSLRPDIVLLDLQMPVMGGIDALTAIRGEDPSARVIVLTTYAGDALVQRALKAGAVGYILKANVRADLLDAVRAVRSGQRRFDAEIVLDLANHSADAQLSVREIHVLELIAAGNSNKRIARELSISEGTVKNHVKGILDKLGANDRTHAVTIGNRRGIIGV
ncbi:response regulator transcription factor [Variovorax sp. Sphag1AA]|uniref:response regulator n=1 Tax=Variovorax sp. Sphag1AA TaxID=2587027 RepID=UPI00160E7BD6|nr:response regulator transcription factor [Variovorax sp. Sphag1AA]MBB3178791.1 DNA-binding NarL/FixJ family response regulator [Variovorax sp. Sphag1AA]